MFGETVVRIGRVLRDANGKPVRDASGFYVLEGGGRGAVVRRLSEALADGIKGAKVIVPSTGGEG